MIEVTTFLGTGGNAQVTWNPNAIPGVVRNDHEEDIGVDLAKVDIAALLTLNQTN